MIRRKLIVTITKEIRIMCNHVKLLAPRIDLLEIFDRIRCDRKVKSCSKYLFRIANFGKVTKEGRD